MTTRQAAGSARSGSSSAVCGLPGCQFPRKSLGKCDSAQRGGQGAAGPSSRGPENPRASPR
eukprot:4457101-Alexandrium_andersonii.AAC.1